MNWEFFWIVAAGGLVTWAIKTSFIESANYFTLPAWFQRALEFVPPAVLCALVVPGLVKGEVGLVIAFGEVPMDPRLFGAAAAIVAFTLTSRTVPTLIAGMVGLYLGYWLQA